jgi:DNA (cytosine-5)-methyltransferase 1
VSAIYNELDPFAAKWLRNLIDAGHIAPGVVDERSIEDLTPADVAGPGQRHFFSGIGGWSYALRLAGISDDADVWTGSCPCQPFSSAGKRGGTSDARHLWPAWFALIEECRPPVIFGEQVASGDGLGWLDAVFADLERCGYAVGAADLCAAKLAPHGRSRLFFVGYANGHAGGWNTGAVSRAEASNPRMRGSANRPRVAGANLDPWGLGVWIDCLDGKRRLVPTEPALFPLAHGVPNRVGLLRGSGNAIVPQVAAAFVRAAQEARER